MVVERLKSCDNIVALAQELGLHRRLLYKWRDQLERWSVGNRHPVRREVREKPSQVPILNRCYKAGPRSCGGFLNAWHRPFCAAIVRCHSRRV